MSARARVALERRVAPVRLVIFDCDGVLIDSEPVANRVVAEELCALGWQVSAAECDRMFLGMSYPDLAAAAAVRLGRDLPDGWVDALLARVIALMQTEAVLVEGARAALEHVNATGLAWCVGSNSSQAEMAAKFGCVGLTAMMRGRLFSGHDVVARGGKAKPAPDLFLEAAAAHGVPAEECLVVEDSPTGIRAARAAGMDVLGLARHGEAAAHAALGALPFASMHDLPELLRGVKR
jgi:beta-phosphoglucomutase-like phosphatase (HAD superfamily)